ncbi:MAG: BLUF domain-containing protein [Rubrivivax sp.]|nr:MAG: BLUF domain-containing protein [Rubrivivax sp.]
MPAPALHRLLYVSEARIDPCGPEPRAILEVAARRNAQLDVTGLLCFSGEHFAQILEGSTAAIETLMTSIRRDSRHILLREWQPQAVPDERRLFPAWAMGFSHDERLDAAMGQLAREPHDLPLDTVAELLFVGLDLYGAQRRR